MADFVFNVAKGRVNSYVQSAIDGTGGAQLTVLALKAADADATLIDLDTVALVLAEAGTTEADFTNYARVDLTSVTRTVDDSGDQQTADFADFTWSSAGGTLDNTLTDLIVYFDPTGSSADSACIPLTMHDFAVTTDGNDLIAQVAAAGFFAAA